MSTQLEKASLKLQKAERSVTLATLKKEREKVGQALVEIAATRHMESETTRVVWRTIFTSRSRVVYWFDAEHTYGFTSREEPVQGGQTISALGIRIFDDDAEGLKRFLEHARYFIQTSF